MDKFMALPFPQRVAAIVGFAVLVAVGTYFGLISPELDRANSARGNLARLAKEVAELQQLASHEEQEALEAKKAQLIEKDKDNRKMLPSDDEVPNFIDSVQADAKRIGLLVRRFERQEKEFEDLYAAIPIKIEMDGTYLQLVEFLRMLAGPERRIMNVRDLVIERVPDDTNALRKQIEANEPVDINLDPKVAAVRRNEAQTPEAILKDRIKVAKLAREQPFIKARFTAYTFTWTGKPAPNDPKKGQVAKKKRRS